MAYYSGHRRELASRPLLLAMAVALLVCMWLPSFFGIPLQARLATDYQGFLYAQLHSWWNPLSVSARLVALLLVVFCSLLIFYSNHRLRYIREDTLLPIFFMFLLSGFYASGHHLSPGIYGLAFMTLALMDFLDFERFSVWTAYDAMFFLSLGSLFTFHLSWYMTPFLVGMLMVKQLNLRTLSASFMGAITPYLLTGGYMYLSNRFNLFWTYLSNVYQSRGFYFDNGQGSWWGIPILAVMGLISLAFFYRQYNNDKIQARLSIMFVFILWIFGSLLHFLYPQPALQMVPVTCLFMSILFSHYFALSKSRFSRIVFILFTLGCVAVYLLTVVF